LGNQSLQFQHRVNPILCYVWSSLNQEQFMNILDKSWLKALWSNEEGQDVAEYAVMLAVIVVIVVSTVRLIGTNAGNVFSQVGSAIQ
jgi:Flp pilus assembly pilin Flp